MRINIYGCLQKGCWKNEKVHVTISKGNLSIQ